MTRIERIMAHFIDLARTGVEIKRLSEGLDDLLYGGGSATGERVSTSSVPDPVAAAVIRNERFHQALVDLEATLQDSAKIRYQAAKVIAEAQALLERQP